MTDANDLVVIERRGPVSVIMLNEPSRMNPFSDAMRAAALTAMAGEMTEPSVSAIVVTGAGGNFSAGADVRQMCTTAVPDPARSKARLAALHALVRWVVSGPKPVVAAVEGCAFGAGLSLAAASDFVVAGDGARFGAAFGKVGLTADCGLLWSLPQRVGMSWAKEMMFTARHVEAAEAQRIGLVNRLVPAGSALGVAVAKAQDYLAIAPLSLAAMKAAISEGPTDLEAVLRLEIHQQVMLAMSADHNEGRIAFLEKRKPVFSGR